MTINTIENYIHTKKIDLNLTNMKLGSYQMYYHIKKTFVPGQNDYSGHSTLTTKLFQQYNLLLYPVSSEFHSLYKEICIMFREICPKDEFDNNQFYIQCWLNFYQKGEFIDWHGHWPADMKAWHGYYCVDCKPSKTTYRIPSNGKEIDIPSEDNLLVLSESGGDLHRTWPWQENRPRITIAFDIVKRKSIMESWGGGGGLPDNHWIPVV
jgi:hypothetical protein